MRKPIEHMLDAAGVECAAYASGRRAEAARQGATAHLARPFRGTALPDAVKAW